MENASKALLMAAGVLIGILLISLAVYLFVDFGSTSAKINEQNAQKQVSQFNSKFTSYEGLDGLTIYDVITVIGYAKENNDFYGDLNEYKIIVNIGNSSEEVQNWTEEKKIQAISIDQGLMQGENLPIYKCKVRSYHENGRVYVINFSRSN